MRFIPIFKAQTCSFKCAREPFWIVSNPCNACTWPFCRYATNVNIRLPNDGFAILHETENKVLGPERRSQIWSNVTTIPLEMLTLKVTSITSCLCFFSCNKWLTSCPWQLYFVDTSCLSESQRSQQGVKVVQTWHDHETRIRHIPLICLALAALASHVNWHLQSLEMGRASPRHLRALTCTKYDICVYQYIYILQCVSTCMPSYIQIMYNQIVYISIYMYIPSGYLT